MPNLDDLKSERRALAAKLAGIMETAALLRSAATEESTILAEIGALGRKEVEAVQQWAADGGQGVMPEPDSQERARLHQALVEAQAKAASIAGAIGDLDTAHRQAEMALQDINAKIDELALMTLQSEHREAVEDLKTFLVVSVQPRVAHVLGLRAMITSLAQQHQGSGRGDKAMDLFRLGEVVANAVPSLEFEPSPGEVVLATSAWRKRLDELAGDTPSPRESTRQVLSFPLGSAA